MRLSFLVPLQLTQSTQKRDRHIKRIKDRDRARKVAAEQRAEHRKRQERKEKRFVKSTYVMMGAYSFLLQT